MRLETVDRFRCRLPARTTSNDLFVDVVLAAAEGELAPACLQAQEYHSADDDDERRPEHAVYDVRQTVRLVHDDVIVVCCVVEAIEALAAHGAPLSSVFVDFSAVVVSVLEANVERTLEKISAAASHESDEIAATEY